MTNIYRTDLSFILDEISKQLNISDTLFEDAEKKYMAVGVWLGEGNSPLASFSPVIYAQGSFLLGTVIKPLGDKDEYDIDLVFETNLSKLEVTQKRVKNLAGDRLKGHETYRKMLDKEGRRCWTLLYADGAKFHLDILPAVPNVGYQSILKSRGLQNVWTDTGISITDKTRSNYERIDPDWPRGNPKGYASWFRSRMLTQFEAQRKHLAEALKSEIANVPEFRIKTPLQRSIQLLKRHRDIAFEKEDDKPASIILTTLTAMAYNNEFDIVEALSNIVDGMPNHISSRDGKPWIQNPVDPLENFADRWQDRPGREQDFYNWQRKVSNDLNTLLGCNDIDRVTDLLVQMFGERVAASAVNRYKEYAQTRKEKINTVVPISRSNKPWGI